MIFQTLDDKSECVGVYVDGKLHFDGIPDDLTKTWKYTGSVQDNTIEYAWLYCGGKNLQAACPEHLKEELTEVQKTFRAYLKSFEIAKINLRDNCFLISCPRTFSWSFARSVTRSQNMCLRPILDLKTTIILIGLTSCSTRSDTRSWTSTWMAVVT